MIEREEYVFGSGFVRGLIWAKLSIHTGLKELLVREQYLYDVYPLVYSLVYRVDFFLGS